MIVAPDGWTRGTDASVAAERGREGMFLQVGEGV